MPLLVNILSFQNECEWLGESAELNVDYGKKPDSGATRQNNKGKEAESRRPSHLQEVRFRGRLTWAHANTRL